MIKPWSDKLRKVDPYVPGEQSKKQNIIKLNANENPYPPSPKVVEAIHNFDTDKLCLYPNSSAYQLTEALAQHYGLDMNQVFVGNGSDEVIALAYMAYFNSPDKPILFPDITYSFYPVWCNFFKTPYLTKAVDENFRINAKDYYEKNGGVIIPNPNAPTGMSEGREFIEEILQHNQDVVVIIDEAYVDFGSYSAVELLKKYENLVIVHTFSKSRSLAGMRIGVALGNPELISLLNAVKNCYNSYTLDSVAIAAGTASVNDDTYFLSTLNKVIETRERTAKELSDLGFKVFPSHSNFLFVTHPTISAKELFEAAKAENIFIRFFDLPRINNHLRISIGTDAQMDALIGFIKKYQGR
ncbi:MAG TPA: histidinol-phosphate transaminase [Lachnospiraceae bacterium]|nr:histidinol-phosphate transaminase [Lachnospiraceae bacterium]